MAISKYNKFVAYVYNDDERKIAQEMGGFIEEPKRDDVFNRLYFMTTAMLNGKSEQTPGSGKYINTGRVYIRKLECDICKRVFHKGYGLQEHKKRIHKKVSDYGKPKPKIMYSFAKTPPVTRAQRKTIREESTSGDEGIEIINSPIKTRSSSTAGRTAKQYESGLSKNAGLAEKGQHSTDSMYKPDMTNEILLSSSEECSSAQNDSEDDITIVGELECDQELLPIERRYPTFDSETALTLSKMEVFSPIVLIRDCYKFNETIFTLPPLPIKMSSPSEEKKDELSGKLSEIESDEEGKSTIKAVAYDEPLALTYEPPLEEKLQVLPIISSVQSIAEEVHENMKDGEKANIDECSDSGISVTSHSDSPQKSELSVNDNQDEVYILSDDELEGLVKKAKDQEISTVKAIESDLDKNNDVAKTESSSVSENGEKTDGDTTVTVESNKVKDSEFEALEEIDPENEDDKTSLDEKLFETISTLVNVSKVKKDKTKELDSNESKKQVKTVKDENEKNQLDSKSKTAENLVSGGKYDTMNKDKNRKGESSLKDKKVQDGGEDDYSLTDILDIALSDAPEEKEKASVKQDQKDKKAGKNAKPKITADVPPKKQAPPKRLVTNIRKNKKQKASTSDEIKEQASSKEKNEDAKAEIKDDPKPPNKSNEKESKKEDDDSDIECVYEDNDDEESLKEYVEDDQDESKNNDETEQEEDNSDIECVFEEKSTAPDEHNDSTKKKKKIKKTKKNKGRKRKRIEATENTEKKQSDATEEVETISDDDGIEVLEESEPKKKIKLKKDSKSIEDQKQREQKGIELSTCLEVGTEVSAKFRGAYCEAKISEVSKDIKCRVTFKNGLGTRTISSDFIKIHKDDQMLVKGMYVKANYPDRDEYFDAVVTDILDQSIYTVIFNDGDVATLKRNGLRIRKDTEKEKSRYGEEMPGKQEIDKEINKIINDAKEKEKELKRNRRQPVNDKSVEENDDDKEKKEKKNKKVMDVVSNLLKKKDDNEKPEIIDIDTEPHENKKVEKRTKTIEDSSSKETMIWKPSNKEATNKETTNKKPFIKQATNKETENKKPLNKETTDKGIIKIKEITAKATTDKGIIKIKETTTKETTHKEATHKDAISKETMNKGAMNKVTTNKETKSEETENKKTKNKEPMTQKLTDSAADAIEDRIKELEKNLSIGVPEKPKPTDVLEINFEQAYPDVFKNFQPKKGVGKVRAKRNSQTKIALNNNSTLNGAKLIWDANNPTKDKAKPKKKQKKLAQQKKLEILKKAKSILGANNPGNEPMSREKKLEIIKNLIKSSQSKSTNSKKKIQDKAPKPLIQNTTNEEIDQIIQKQTSNEKDPLDTDMICIE